MSNHSIPMTAARGMGSLPELVEARDGARALKRLFDRVDLPLSVRSEPDATIPLHDLVALFEGAATTTGDPLFGLRIGTQMADKFGVWSRYARSAHSLRGCLARAARGIHYHQSGTRLELSTVGERAKFSYHMDLRRPSEGRQHLDHTVPALLRAFQAYAGASWRPYCVEVDYSADRRVKDVEDMLGIPVHSGAPAMAIVFDADMLDLPLDPGIDQGPPVTTFDLQTMVRRRPPRDIVGIVEQIARTRLLDGKADIDGVAVRLGTGTRTLQRQLDGEGRSYREIVADVRLARARHLLVETKIPITEIAYSLGYSDPAHFSRAFRRVAAQSPNTYRRGNA